MPWQCTSSPLGGKLVRYATILRSINNIRQRNHEGGGVGRGPLSITAFITKVW